MIDSQGYALRIGAVDYETDFLNVVHFKSERFRKGWSVFENHSRHLYAPLCMVTVPDSEGGAPASPESGADTMQTVTHI